MQICKNLLCLSKAPFLFTLVYDERALQQAFKATADDMAAWIFSPDAAGVGEAVGGITTTVGGATLPKHWEPMAATESHKEVMLHTTSAEYQKIAEMFDSSGGPSAFEIISIRRLQQKYTWLQYELRKTQMNARDDGTGANEKQLWHGAPSETVPKIIKNGFNRTFVSTVRR